MRDTRQTTSARPRSKTGSASAARRQSARSGRLWALTGTPEFRVVFTMGSPVPVRRNFTDAPAASRSRHWALPQHASPQKFDACTTIHFSLENFEQSDRAGSSGRETANRHDAGLQGLRDRAITIAGIELMHRIRKGQFGLGRLSVQGRLAPAVWNAVLQA